MSVAIFLGAMLLMAVDSFAAVPKPTNHDHGGAMVRIPGHVLPALSKAKIVPSKANSGKQTMTLTIVLKRDNQAGFDRYLKDVYDPKSKHYRHFLTQRQIADRFGPSRADYKSVLRYLRQNGFKLVRGSKNRLTLSVRGSRAKVEKAFALKINDYRIGGATFYANSGDPALPKALASRVAAVSGLSNLARPKRARQVILLLCEGLHLHDALEIGGALKAFSAFSVGEQYGIIAGIAPEVPEILAGVIVIEAGAIVCLAAEDYDNFAKKYPAPDGWGGNGGQWWNYPPIKALTGGSSKNAAVAAGTTGLSYPDGTGQTIGLLEFDTFNPGDVSDFLNLSGELGGDPGQIGNLSEVPVNGGVAAPGSGEGEVLLDIDTAMGIAPGAKVVVYDAPFNGRGSSYEAAFNAMIDGGVTVISNSWASCEDEVPVADAQGIDTVLQNAALAGISVFNGTGDSGSTCLDGSANTSSVPADSPNATAVGGSSLTPGADASYGSEKWWDGSTDVPPTGQGGFAVSKIFSRPSYQNGLNASAMRSIPDVVAPADPAINGAWLCQADDGGCPSGKQFGGTSMSAPEWAALAALLNQAQGRNLGFLNPVIYPLAATDAFHSSASMGSDFTHVGLGSPNLNVMNRLLSGGTAGLPDPGVSQTAALMGLPPFPVLAGDPTQAGDSLGLPADGTQAGGVIVRLLDANGYTVSGKTVTVTASGSASVTPPSAVTNVSNGAAVFSVSDLVPENVTFTVTDTTDGITLSNPPSVAFGVPPATSALLVALPSTVTADGVSAATITVTLQDSLGRPTPGKIIAFSQGRGSSVISGPIPAVTDGNGQIRFTATDTNGETVTYSATDVSDGNLPFPSTASVTFQNSPVSACGSGIPTAAPGYIVTPVATGFQAGPVFFGDINFGDCMGAFVPAFDSAGNMYVSDFYDGNLYKFGPGGGVAGAGTMLASIGQTLAQPAFSGGNLWVVRAATSGGVSPAGFFEVDTSTGAILNSFTGVFCSTALASDPLTGDLFTDTLCYGVSPNLVFSNLTGSPPVFATYAAMPGNAPGYISFLPGGTMYLEGGFGDPATYVAQVSGTNVTPTTVTQLSGLAPADGGIVALGSDNTAQALILNLPGGGGPNGQTTLVDLTTSPSSISSTLTVNSVLGHTLTLGPDGCLYGAAGNAVYKLSKSDGTCPFASPTQPLSLVLSPVNYILAQGSPETLTASVHFGTVAAGTPITFKVTGANPQAGLVNTDSNGNASFTYIGTHQGADTIVASAAVPTSVPSPTTTIVASNPATVTWVSGTDVTFLTLNQSPGGAAAGATVNLSANLTDVSANPVTPLASQTVSFSLSDGSGCSATADSNGNAVCQVTPSGTGTMTLSANFAGTAQYNPSWDSRGFNVIVPATPSPTVTATETATPTATPTNVPGKLKIQPSRLNFGSVTIGSNKTKTVKITNGGKSTKKKTALPIVIETEDTTSGSSPSPFSTTQCVPNDQLDPKSKGVLPGTCTVTVTFAPTSAAKYTGDLVITDNVDPSQVKKWPALVQKVPMTGTGKAPK